MSATALSFVIAAAPLQAPWNVVARHAGGDHRFAPIAAAQLAVTGSPLAAWVGVDALPRD